MQRLRALRIERQAVDEDIRKTRYERENQYRIVRDCLELIQRAKDTFANGTTDQKKAILRALGSNWKIIDQKLTCEENFIVSALHKTKELHSAEIERFELTKNKAGSDFVPDRVLVSNIWSAKLDAIRIAMCSGLALA